LHFDLNNIYGPVSSSIIADGNWHFACVRNSSGNVQLYVDGSTNGNPQFMTPNITSGDQCIGTSRSVHTTDFIGMIDEVGIWNRALTSLEIAVLYNNGHGLTVNNTAVSSPFIITSPQNQTVNAGSSVTFNVIATGGALNYQWQFKGQNIPGANNATHALNAVAATNSGIYSVVIWNAYGSANASARLTISSPLTLTQTNRVPVTETNPSSSFPATIVCTT